MNESQTKSLYRYEEIKLSIKELEAELEELKPELLAVIPEGTEIEAKHGSFTLKARPKWEYSEPTQKAEKSLKETKKREEADGTAKEIPGTPFIEYRTRKEDKED